MNLYREVPIAIFKWTLILLASSVLWVLTYPVSIIIALTARKQTSHPFGKPLSSVHRDKYIEQGSSGHWEYWNSNIKMLTHARSYIQQWCIILHTVNLDLVSSESLHNVGVHYTSMTK